MAVQKVPVEAWKVQLGLATADLLIKVDSTETSIARVEQTDGCDPLTPKIDSIPATGLGPATGMGCIVRTRCRTRN
jgi:hypothetical protein